MNEVILTSVGHVRRPHDATNLLHVLEVGREAAVAAAEETLNSFEKEKKQKLRKLRPVRKNRKSVSPEDLLVDERSYGQAVEAVRKRLPQLDREATLA